jgi:hypothetical protein
VGVGDVVKMHVYFVMWRRKGSDLDNSDALFRFFFTDVAIILLKEMC